MIIHYQTLKGRSKSILERILGFILSLSVNKKYTKFTKSKLYVKIELRGEKMLFAVINAEVEKYRAKKFTGHLKFGIENSKVVSMTENSRLEESQKDNDDFENKLLRLCSNPSFFGSIEFDLHLGNIERLNYCMSFNGQNLKEKLGAK